MLKHNDGIFNGRGITDLGKLARLGPAFCQIRVFVIACNSGNGQTVVLSTAYRFKK